MRLRRNKSRINRVCALTGISVTIGLLGTVHRAGAEERRFAVMLAHSPKAFDADGTPGLPPGGLPGVSLINRDYFDKIDPSINSFAEYWEEISYGDVTISGKTFGWITLPWAFELDGPNQAAKPSPEDYINIHTGTMPPASFTTLAQPPTPFGYGAGEDFCDSFTSSDSTIDVSTSQCGALIIHDFTGNARDAPAPRRFPGMSDMSATGMNVWTPGERFIDLDDDGRWDGIDEKNDMICDGPDGCTNLCTYRMCDGARTLGCGPTVGCASGERCIIGGRCWDSSRNYNPTAEGRNLGCLSDADCLLLDDGTSYPLCDFGGSQFPCPDDSACFDGQVCGDPRGSGPRGCDIPGCGNLGMACVDWDDDGECNNPSPCTAPERIICTFSTDCPRLDTRSDPESDGVCLPAQEPGGLRYCLPTNCVPSTANGTPNLPDCCDDANPTEGCVSNGSEGVTCGEALECCEFEDSDGDGNVNAVEPFEDYMIRWNPSGGTPSSVWIPVTEAYVRANYPGDVEALVRRTGNSFYDPPDLFIDRGDTKMMQDAAPNQYANATPKPGARYAAPPVSEQAWFDQWWDDTYGTPPPIWPNEGTCTQSRVPCSNNNDCFPAFLSGDTCVGNAFNSAFPPDNSPRMREFDPENPVPLAVGGEEGRIWFRPNAGGSNGRGDGTSEDPNIVYSTGGDDFAEQVLPEERFGFYDGWVEHDDLASSKYHHSGDKRLGEITSPTTDTVFLPGDDEPYTAIFGVDLGTHTPITLQTPDGFKVAAGPYAVKIHGEKGFDAGDLCITEWLTWRTDGTTPSIAYRWEADNGPYHPFAGPKRCARPGLPPPRNSSFDICVQDSDCPAGETCSAGSAGLGFRDYNLNGMIDQGEVRPPLSENYSVDSDAFTGNDGNATLYPFNRRRLAEDVIEALDPSVDWDDFNDVNAMNANLCVTWPGANDTYQFDYKNLRPTDPFNSNTVKMIEAEAFVSGIIIVPPGSYTDTESLFPTAPSFYPVHNEDNNDQSFMYPDWPADPFVSTDVHISNNLFFHDLVICADCRFPIPSVINYAAHEYGHTWEGWPDLYDYDVFTDGLDEENCPIGRWDLMAGGSAGGGLVHSIPILKSQSCTDWIAPVDLTTVVTPGVETTITLPPAESVRDGSYYFLENPERSDERYWLWSAGTGFDEPRDGGGLPATGLLILHTNVPNLGEGLPLQQRTPPWGYFIVQADGRNDLESCTSVGNGGDDGDPWPGSEGKTKFNFSTNPPATWYGQNQWTGLDITNIEPDARGSMKVTLSWTPTNIPSLRFIQPPGGETVGSVYQVRFNATDVYGGTRIQIFATQRSETSLAFGGNGAFLIGDFKKVSPGTVDMSFDWDITNVDDGNYFFFAKLIPGLGADGVELESTRARPGAGNVGNGTLSVKDVSIDDDVLHDDDKARSETWTIKCIDPNGLDWKVASTLSYPERAEDANLPPDPKLVARTGSDYESPGNEIKFRINGGSTDYGLGDTFTFTTTGYTAKSQGVEIENSRITEGPTAVLDADIFTGAPPLEVRFDARRSTDPNNQPLEFEWDFGDGRARVVGAEVTHSFELAGTFIVVLTARNPLSGRFDTATQDIIVINNTPTARIAAIPNSGPPPLTVQFNAEDSNDKETENEDLVYQWDFGDGKTANDAGVRGVLTKTDHFYSAKADGTPCTTEDPCSFVAKLTVTDENGSEGEATVTILVGNTRPTPIVDVKPLAGPAPLEVEFNASGSIDPDGDSLTIVWDWGDGEKSDSLALSDVASRVVKHIYEIPDTYKPTAVLTDEHGASTNWTGDEIVVTGNRAPNAVILADPTEGTQNIDTFTFDARQSRDPDGDIVSYEWDFGDGIGTASGNKVTYVYPKASETGFTVVLTVTDDRDVKDTASVVIVVKPDPGNQPPTAHIATLPRACTQPCTITLDGSLSFDPNGDALAFTWNVTSSAGATVTTRGESVFVDTFDLLGIYTISLTVKELRENGDALSDTAGPIVVEVVPPGTILPPLADQPSTLRIPEPPNSANQRPGGAGLCGISMVMSLFGSLFGLAAMAVARRRRFRI